MARIASAQNAVSEARGQARAPGQVPSMEASLWATALINAEAVMQLCEDGAVDADTRAGAATLLAVVQQEQQAAAADADRLAQDTAMIERLEALRIPPIQAAVIGSALLRPWHLGWRLGEQRRLDAAYAEAFADYQGGSSLLEQDTAVTLASLQGSAIATELATSLDHWGLVRDDLRDVADAPDAGDTRRIRALAMQIDADDPWRRQLRSLLPEAAAEGPRLMTLFEEVDFSTLSAGSSRVLAEALWRANEREAAVSILRSGQRLHPLDFDVCLALATSIEQLGQSHLKEAAETFRLAGVLRPDQRSLLNCEARALSQLGRHEEVERLFRLRFAQEPDNAPLLGNIGNVLRGQGKLDEAAESYKLAFELDPEYGGALVNLALIYNEEGDFDKAVEYMHRAIAIEPQLPGAHMNLGAMLHNQGNVEEAIASYLTALENDEYNAGAHTNLGLVYRERGAREGQAELSARNHD